MEVSSTDPSSTPICPDGKGIQSDSDAIRHFDGETGSTPKPTMEVPATKPPPTSTPICHDGEGIHDDDDAIHHVEDETDSNQTQIQVKVKIVISPGSSQHYIPMCDPVLKPYVNQRFSSVDDGIEFYRRYAANSGFDIRLGTASRARDGSISNQSRKACSRNFILNFKNDPSSVKPHSMSFDWQWSLHCWNLHALQ
ncbi:hypothetical protein CASFOL_016925 [Castilleja foliolosa]|uniref:FAR1 domain-containing protein n=1 Tax=Castilleja foliolosa TaxID=1961234 RepID=A0ABD3DA42_9LAMI